MRMRRLDFQITEFAVVKLQCFLKTSVHFCKKNKEISMSQLEVLKIKLHFLTPATYDSPLKNI